MAFVDAYDKRTGKKLAHRVPESHIDHPVLGRNLSRTPRAKAKADAAPKATKRAKKRATKRPVDPTNAPAVGDDKKE